MSKDRISDVCRMIEHKLRDGKPWEALISLAEWCREFRSLEEFGPNEHVSRLTSLGINPRCVESLEEYGYLTLGTVAQATDAELLEVPKIAYVQLQHIRAALLRLDELSAARHSIRIDAAG